MDHQASLGAPIDRARHTQSEAHHYEAFARLRFVHPADTACHSLLCACAQCSTDGLTRWTRVQGDYSKNTVAVLSEVIKFPLIAAAISSFGGGSKEVLPTFRAAFTSRPFKNMWIGLCYTFNNLLYFDALTALSAVAYQVLSQSKTLFTAGLMYFVVGKKLIFRQARQARLRLVHMSMHMYMHMYYHSPGLASPCAHTLCQRLEPAAYLP